MQRLLHRFPMRQETNCSFRRMRYTRSIPYHRIEKHLMLANQPAHENRKGNIYVRTLASENHFQRIFCLLAVLSTLFHSVHFAHYSDHGQLHWCYDCQL
jgi:hypothetical protein